MKRASGLNRLEGLESTPPSMLPYGEDCFGGRPGRSLQPVVSGEVFLHHVPARALRSAPPSSSFHFSELVEGFGPGIFPPEEGVSSVRMGVPPGHGDDIRHRRGHPLDLTPPAVGASLCRDQSLAWHVPPLKLPPLEAGHPAVLVKLFGANAPYRGPSCS